MTSKEEIMNDLSNNITLCKKRINNIKKHNIKNNMIRFLLKLGIKLDYILPYFLATIIVYYTYSSITKNPPFQINDIEEQESIETIDTSTGIHQENRSFDKIYLEEALKYSTGWEKNEEGLYERTLISYKLTDDIDLNDIDKILAMSKEEIEDLLEISNIETITKKQLNSEDKLFMEDTLIVKNHTMSNNTLTRRETEGQNSLNSFFYLILVGIIGLGFNKIKNIFINTKIRDILGEKEKSLRPLSKEEIEIVKQLLLLKKENLSLLEDEEQPKQYRRLRKDEPR